MVSAIMSPRRYPYTMLLLMELISINSMYSALEFGLGKDWENFFFFVCFCFFFPKIKSSCFRKIVLIWKIFTPWIEVIILLGVLLSRVWNNFPESGTTSVYLNLLLDSGKSTFPKYAWNGMQFLTVYESFSSSLRRKWPFPDYVGCNQWNRCPN